MKILSKHILPAPQSQRRLPYRATAVGIWNLNFLWILGFGIWNFPLRAADWPTHMANNQRTGVTPEQLPDAALVQKWLEAKGFTK